MESDCPADRSLALSLPRCMPIVNRQPLATLRGDGGNEPQANTGTKRKHALTENCVATGSESNGGCGSGCRSCREEIQVLKEDIKTLNVQLEARMHIYVQEQVQSLMASMAAKMELQERPAKKAKKISKLQGRRCFVCGGQEGPVMNRQLGVVLDDRCRKQVDVIKHGGKLTERKELWDRAIVHIHTPAALMIAQKLGVEPVDPCNHQNVTACTEKDGLHLEPCAVCQEPMGLGARVQTLECGSRHTFHHECIGWWLVESATCPLCREDLSGHQQQCDGKHKPPDCGFGRNPSAETSCADGASADFPVDFDMMMELLDSPAQEGVCAGSVLDWELQLPQNSCGAGGGPEPSLLGLCCSEPLEKGPEGSGPCME